MEILEKDCQISLNVNAWIYVSSIAGATGLLGDRQVVIRWDCTVLYASIGSRPSWEGQLQLQLKQREVGFCSGAKDVRRNQI